MTIKASRTVRGRVATGGVGRGRGGRGNPGLVSTKPLFSQKGLLPGKSLRDDHLQGTGLCELVDNQGWGYYMRLKEYVHPHLMVQFYSNLRIEGNNLVSQVGKYSIKLNAKTLGNILKMPGTRLGEYFEQQWPEHLQSEWEQMCDFFGDAEVLAIKKHLNGFNKALHSLIVHNVMARLSKDKSGNYVDVYYVWKLAVGVKVNLPLLMMNHMIYIRDCRNSMGYGMALTVIFRALDIPLENETFHPFNPSWYFGVGHLKKMGVFFDGTKLYNNLEFESLDDETQENIIKFMQEKQRELKRGKRSRPSHIESDSDDANEDREDDEGEGQEADVPPICHGLDSHTFEMGQGSSQPSGSTYSFDQMKDELTLMCASIESGFTHFEERQTAFEIEQRAAFTSVSTRLGALESAQHTFMTRQTEFMDWFQSTWSGGPPSSDGGAGPSHAP